MYNKNDIDKQAEREGAALRKVGQGRIDKRVIFSKGNKYNENKFNKLFRR